MSAILSADDLNDFISPGVACIKPVETLPAQRPDEVKDPSNPYEVTTEDAIQASAADAPPAQISLTDCLACSGCVTSAEAVLIGLQSHEEVLNTLAKYRSLSFEEARAGHDGKIFVATVSPQTRANLAATYDITAQEAGWQIEQLLAGPQGLQKEGNAFQWILDSNSMRDVCLEAAVQEMQGVLDPVPNANESSPLQAAPDGGPKRPILASGCPGWICYAEKTHPHVLPHLSRLKSPQALTGTMVKSVLGRKYGIAPDKIWHVAIMPCFDKKLEASREELTDSYWRPEQNEKRGIRDVDCVITARELLMLADIKRIRFPDLPRQPLNSPPFPDAVLNEYLRASPQHGSSSAQQQEAGTSDGYAHRLILAEQHRRPGSIVKVERGRNVDIVEYLLLDSSGGIIMKTARYYGFRNIQNLVRKLKPAKTSRLAGRRNMPSTGATSGLTEYAYVEVMACPGGCTNGGGQIKASDVSEIRGLPGQEGKKVGPGEQKAWLARIDEAYYSAESSDDEDGDAMEVDAASPASMLRNGGQGPSAHTTAAELATHWSRLVDLDLKTLLFTTYREVESDVGKAKKASDMERVAGLASSIGGGW